MHGPLNPVFPGRGAVEILPEVPNTDNQVGVEMIFLDPAELDGAADDLPAPGPGGDAVLRTRFQHA
jgi:hypothetical protein